MICQKDTKCLINIDFTLPIIMLLLQKIDCMKRPVNISSNTTLALKVFLPIFWIVFFGAMTIAFFFSSEASVGGISMNAMRLLMSSFVLTGAAVLYFSVMQLVRVEMDDQFVYITNYRQTARYPYHQVEKIEALAFPIFKIYRLHLKNKGIFGEKVTFLSSRYRFDDFLAVRPDVKALIVDEA